MAADAQNLLARTVRDGYRRGWSFTPLAGKRPTLKGWQNRPRESLDEALGWAGEGNVGLRTGRISGVVVLDADPGADVEALDLPETVTAATGRDGAAHYYFACRGRLGNSSGKLGEHIDVKADGGQVVLPGSVHPDTHRQYRWQPGRAPWEAALAPLPARIRKRLNPPPKRPPTRRTGAPAARDDDARRYATQALRLELNALYQAERGRRNDTLNRAAFNLGTLVGASLLDRDELAAELAGAAEAIGLPAGEAEATVRSGLDAGVKHPRRIESRAEAVRAVAGDEPAGPASVVRDDAPALPRGRFAMDLYGNADRFCHLHGRDVHWCDERGRWYVWTGRCWQPDAVREVQRLAERTLRALLAETRGDKEASKWAGRCNRTAAAARDMLEVVKHRTAIELSAFDRDPWLLGAANGVIDLRTGELLDHRRGQRITMLSPVAYDGDAACPRWQRFLGEIMAGDEAMIAALQRLAGYCLTGDVSVQVLPILYGPGSNGKNVLLDTLVGILGPHAAEAPEGLLTARQSDEHPTEIADLCAKRLVVASETEENRKLRIGLVKKTTGNKYLKGRFMRQDYFQFVRTHKTVLVTNNRPVVAETSHAIWRRLRLIPFEVTIPAERQDRRLTEKLVAEWPGILAWAVQGCLDWQRRRDLAFPEAVRQATEAYRSDSDHVGDFLTECCVDWRQHPEQKMRTPKEKVYLAYCDWCKAIGEDALNRTGFNSRMRGHDYEDKAVKYEGRTQKCWLHLTLQDKQR